MSDYNKSTDGVMKQKTMSDYNKSTDGVMKQKTMSDYNKSTNDVMKQKTMSDYLFESYTLWYTVLYKMINDNNILIYKHEITLINSNIINDIVNIIITKTINIQIV